MAEGKELTPEELEQVQELLGPLNESPDSGVFAPMQEQFQADMQEFAPEADDESAFSPEVFDADPLPGKTEDSGDSGAGADLDDLANLLDSSGGGDSGGPDLDPGEFDFGQPDATTDSDPAEPGDFGDLGDFGDAGDAGDFGNPGDFGAPDAFGGGDSGLDLDDIANLDLDGGGGDSDALGGSDDFGDFGDIGTDAGDGSDDLLSGGGDLDFGLPDSAGGGDDASLDFDSPDGDFGADFGADLDAGDGAADFGDDSAPVVADALDADGGADEFGDLGGLGDLDDFGADAGSAGAGEFDLVGDAGGSDFGSDDLGGDLGQLDDFGSSDAGGLDAGAPDFGDGGELELSDDLGGSDFGDPGDMDLGGGLDLGGDLGTDLSVPADIAADPGDLTLNMSDLDAMSEAAQLETGIGDEFTDEDLARIRQGLTDYPPGIKKSVIDVVINEKISQPDQRLLMNMIIDQALPDQIADFIDARLGYRPDTTPSQVTKDGVQIIYADHLSPEEMARRRSRNRWLALMAGIGVFALGTVIGSILIFNWLSIKGRYNDGLEALYEARNTVDPGRRLELKKIAEENFEGARKAAGGTYDSDYLNRYGIAYMNAGFYDEGFEKLYGRVTPDYGSERVQSAWSFPERRAPLIRMATGVPWPDPEASLAGRKAILTDRDNVRRSVEVPGAFIVDRLRDNELRRTTLINLARFHSNKARNFVEGEAGARYKNDALAIDYYRLILTLMNRPDDVEAIAGIGEIYYNQGNFAAAAREYEKIIDKSPMEIKGHAGLLNTYIELWKSKGDPRLVLAKHREIRKAGLEEDLPIYLTTKLAGFYIDIDEDELRIKYQVDPIDALSGLDIKDNAAHLLEIVFNKEEERDGQTIVGSQYGEAFYQRGRFLMRQSESLRALKQFQNAHNYDKRHYLAVNAIGEYYKDLREFDRAAQYFEEAARIYARFQDTAGNRPEDETLLAGDYGKIFYNLGSLIFLRNAGFSSDARIGFPDTRIYPDRGRGPETVEDQNRRRELLRAREYFAEALNQDLRSPQARANLTFWTGWIDYVSGDFESALRQWESIDPVYSNSDPVLLIARGNSYFYTDQIRAALGNYLKLEGDFERLAQGIERPDQQNDEQRYIFLSLAAIYNNIGAVYEKEFIELKARGGAQQDLRELEQNALRYYYNSIESARKMSLDNEVARTNVQLAFKYGAAGEVREPLIDDWVPPVLHNLKEDI